MRQKLYFTITGGVFAIVSLAHLIRVLFGWAVSVDSFLVPMWVSVAGFIVAGGIAVWAFRLRINDHQ